MDEVKTASAVAPRGLAKPCLVLKGDRSAVDEVTCGPAPLRGTFVFKSGLSGDTLCNGMLKLCLIAVSSELVVFHCQWYNLSNNETFGGSKGGF